MPLLGTLTSIRRALPATTPVAIGCGRSVPGHSLFWAVVGRRLYLFYNEQMRVAFLADPGRIIDTAERKWPDCAQFGPVTASWLKIRSMRPCQRLPRQ